MNNIGKQVTLKFGRATVKANVVLGFGPISFRFENPFTGKMTGNINDCQDSGKFENTYPEDLANLVTIYNKQKAEVQAKLVNTESNEEIDLTQFQNTVS